MSKLTVDLEQVGKFNVPGPRYTSYPPATQFTEDVPERDLLEAIRRNNESARDLSLYFHLPFCESLCWFCGCTTVITTQHGKAKIYLDSLAKELDLMSRHLNPERVVKQVHLGGGTPTFFAPDEIEILGELIHSRFRVAGDVEAGVEIDPRHADPDKLKALRQVGFNRASIGVQDNNPEVQKAVHRVQPYELTRDVVDWIREAGFESLNIDLIYGLPHQTEESFEKTLDEILELKPDRLAIFSYAHVPWIKPSQKIFKPEDMPDAESKLRILKLTVEKITSNGFAYIGMDHFARLGDPLAEAQREKTMQRNFQGYSTTGGVDIYSFGMSSISQIEDAYWQNEKTLPEYEKRVEAGELPIAKGCLLSEDDRIRRETIMRLMCDLELDYAAMSERIGRDFAEYFADELESLDELEAQGLLFKHGDGITVTDLGRLLIRVIAMKFDAYLAKGREGKFSKVI